ncbi:opioid growth factor receptor-related protein [Parachlamydia sp. AcF125]|uniref:opioid growth factor receptor-related protein n=1 Tax=Parachlamydia sp. AcF125 TaxID=2795736 RepID=UPI001BC8CFD5|nr:opioid growth factor receptor-related protein [Parachlamydia sp. AcF125]MBS4168266.1 hypothetical protein [Parachlamydia sp. AcF125]
MSDNLDILFSTKIDQDVLKTHRLCVHKIKNQGRVIELLPNKKLSLGEKIRSIFDSLFGIQQRQVVKFCLSSPALEKKIVAIAIPEELETFKKNVACIQDWITAYNKRIGIFKFLLGIRPMPPLTQRLNAKLSTLKGDNLPEPLPSPDFKAHQVSLASPQKEAYAILKSFLRGEGKNRGGHPVTIEEIHRYTYEEKEEKHDFIQWLFPSSQPSAYNPHAPVLTEDLLDELVRDEEVMKNLKKSFLVMLDFYGLKYEKGKVDKASHFETRTFWIRPGDHNHQRITRILECLGNFGLIEEKKSFLDFLRTLKNEFPHGISEVSFKYWEAA